MSDETGGRTIVVRNEKNLEQAFDQISEELRSQYTLGYYSTNTARDGSFRKLKVESTRKDVRRAQPPRVLRTDKLPIRWPGLKPPFAAALSPA